jgi:hypothetical protein
LHAGASGLMLMSSLSWSQEMKNTVKNELWASIMKLDYTIYSDLLRSYVTSIWDNRGINVFKLVNEKCILTKWHIFVWIVCDQEKITCYKIFAETVQAGLEGYILIMIQLTLSTKQPPSIWGLSTQH